MFRTKVVEKIKTHVLGSVISFAVYEIMWKNTAEGQATEDMAHAHCTLGI